MPKLSRTLVLTTFLSILFFSCSQTNESKPELSAGMWRGVLNIQEQLLPFNFEIEKIDSSYQLFLRNAEEKILLDEITFFGDSIKIALHIFDSDIVAHVYPDSLAGYWIKNYAEGYKVPFTASANTDFRFSNAKIDPKADFSGKYKATFIHDEKDTVHAIGIFKQVQNKVTGTFLTPTGDYRYLEGVVENKQMKLSTFDGGHAFLFTANLLIDGTLSGKFWSGKTWHEPWTAFKDDSVQLPNLNDLTFLKEGYNKIEFSFPDVDGKLVSPDDNTFRNKVRIIQLFGTWCPNCMDETKFLASWYDENKHRGVEVIGIAYEAKNDFAYAQKRLQKIKEKLGVNYPLLFGGSSNKEEASKTLPMLNHIMAFPTTLFLDKNGVVRKIHTGFTGPGTGSHYESFVKDYNELTTQLLEENN